MMTQLKVLKLVYYAQGFHLALYGAPLFSGSIEAWDYGPVCLEVRSKLIGYGAKPIASVDQPTGVGIEDEQALLFLEAIYQRFGDYTAGQLVDLTHQEHPWIEAYYRQEGGAMISQNSMQTYFSSRLQEIRDLVCESSESYADRFLSDFAGEVEEITSLRGHSNAQFSQEFIERTDGLAEKLASQGAQEMSDVEIAELAKALASYRD